MLLSGSNFVFFGVEKLADAGTNGKTEMSSPFFDDWLGVFAVYGCGTIMSWDGCGFDGGGTTINSPSVGGGSSQDGGVDAFGNIVLVLFVCSTSFWCCWP